MADCFDTSLAAQFIRNNGVNVQVEFALDWDGGTIFVMRATPWRNSASPNRMILVAGITLDDALCTIAEELDTKSWIRLDWRARPVEAGVYDGDTTVPRRCQGAPHPTKGKKPRKVTFLDEYTDPGENGA